MTVVHLLSYLVCFFSLQEKIDQLQEEMVTKEAELRKLGQHLEQSHQKHAQQLDTQMQFNMANDKTIRR